MPRRRRKRSITRSRDLSENAHAAAEPKELTVIPGVDQVALDDWKDVIPLDGLQCFFDETLSA